MQDTTIKNFDTKLKIVLQNLNMSVYHTPYTNSLYICNCRDVDKDGLNKFFKYQELFEIEQGVLTSIQQGKYTEVIVKNNSKKIFLDLYKILSPNEKELLFSIYDVITSFDTVFSLLTKELRKENKAIYFISNYKFRGALREVNNEEKFIKNLYQVDKENFDKNLLAYLSINQYAYKDYVFKEKYQEMLKNFIQKNVPSKRNLFSLFVGDSDKKLKDNDLIIDRSEYEDEFIIKLNKTFIAENYIPKTSLNYKIYEEQKKILQILPDILMSSQMLAIKTINEIHVQDEEIKFFYITKDKTDKSYEATKQIIIESINNMMSFWVKNYQELSSLDNTVLISEISKKADTVAFYDKLNNQLDNNKTKNIEIKI